MILLFVFAAARFFPIQPIARRFFPSMLDVGMLDVRMFSNPFRRRHRLFHDVRDLRDLVNAHERVHFGQEFGQFVAETLRQATGNNQTLAAMVRLADFGGFENGVHAFLLRGVNERAGVDDDGVGLGGVIGDFHAAFQKRAEHDFGVHEIFGAAERNQADAQRAFASRFRPHQRAFIGMFFRHRRIKLREAADDVENYLATELAVFVSTVSGALVETAAAGGALVEAVSGGRRSCVRSTARAA